MGLYQRHIFPRLMERTIGSEAHLDLRRELLATARGHVLEIGLGTGLNLPCYPERVERLTAVEPEPMLEDRLAERIREAPFPVELLRLDASGRLPLPEGSVDTGVSTWTLCTVPDAVGALRELRRALAPEGRLLFMEHGRSRSARAARWQDRLNPIQNRVACGCHLNREIDVLVRRAGFRIVSEERFLLPDLPEPLALVFADVYRGRAEPAEPESPGDSREDSRLR